jgi:hypothetical protein
MDWASQLGGLLQQYTGMSPEQAPAETTDHFQQVASVAPKEHVAEGLAEAFRSNQTPAFGSMLSNLFGQSDPNQRAGLLNTLLSSVGPGVLASVLSRSGSGGGILDAIRGGGHITPEQASQVPPEAVHEMAAEAEKKNPSVVDRVGEFYADHPTLVQALGAGALAVAMGKMGHRL